MKRLLVPLLFLFLCFSPAVAQFGEADAATIVLEQLEINEEHGQALAQIRALDLAAASPQRRVELALLAADHAISLRRFDLHQKYLQMATASLEQLHPSGQAMARFLLLTLRQRADGLLNPGAARRSLLPNLESALKTLDGYEIDEEDGELWICTRLFLGRAFAYWARELVEHQILLDREVAGPIGKVREKAEAVALDWATTERATPSLGVYHGYFNELLAVQESLHPDDPLYSLLDSAASLEAVLALARERDVEGKLEESLRALGVEQKLDGLVEATFGRLVARRALYQVSRLAEQAWGRSYTAEEAVEVRTALQEASVITRDQASYKLVSEFFVVGFEAAFSSTKPGWQKAARQAFGSAPDFLKDYPELSTRYYIARARLNLLENELEKAEADAQKAVEIYQSWIQQAGLSDEGLDSYRRRAALAHELLIEARLRSDNPEGALAAAVSYQVLESLSVLAAGKRTQPFGKTTAAGLRKSLGTDEVLLLFFPGRQKLTTFLLSSQDLKARQVDLPSRTLQDKVFKLLAENRRLGATEPLRKELYQDLLGPYPLTRWKRVKIAPSSYLSNLPWGSLLNSEGQSLAQTHSVGVKLGYGQAASSGSKPAGLHALGNPDGSLPSAELEVELIAEMVTDSEVATGPEADQDFVDSFDHGIMHFATHGVVNYRKPHSSYLLLAGGEQLAAREIAEGSWKEAQLVVLSACNTGISNVDFVGHRSLAGAFLKSGAPAVLGTLWPVDDLATQAFMTHFYEALNSGSSPLESLNKAQLELLGTPDFNHPYYWGAFVLFEV
ncbi:MAG: CHAT domain-containing protein [Vulcanimicrobiota bacterium]